ncbi:MAG: AAA family ATPase [Gloeotrichia echinulata HAB0833]
MSQNPFVIGKPVPPERFVGRTFEIAVAYAHISQRGHLALWGGPGMGRSSFLELLASPEVWEQHGEDPSQTVIVLVNCENINPFTPSGFWREVLTVLKDNLENLPALQTEIDKFLANEQTTKDTLSQVLQKLGKQKKFLLLLVDDFDAALHKNEQYTEANMQQFLSEIRSLAVHSPAGKHLSMVVTSLNRLNELGPQLNFNASPWYNHYLFQSLKPLTDKEVKQLLQPLAIHKKPELREAIREIAGGHPRLLQIAGFLLHEIERRTSNKPDPQAFIKEFESRNKQLFQFIWTRCSEVEQGLLMLIALSGLKGRLHKNRTFDLSDIDLIFSIRERELTNLEEQGVIIRTIEEGKPIIYSFTSAMMEQWVIQENWLTKDASIKEREKVFAKLVSTKQLGQINWFWNHRNNLLDGVEFFGKLVDAFKILF